MNDRIDLAGPSGPAGAVGPVPAFTHPGLEDIPARHASRAAVLVLALRVAGALAGVAVTALLTRQLGPARFGELGVIFSLTLLAGAAAELGTTYVVAAEMAAFPSRRRELAAGVAVVRGLAGLVFAAVGAVVLVLLLERRDAVWAGVATLATLPLAALSSLVVLHQARLRPHVGAALSLGQSLVWLLAVVVGGVIDAPLWFYGTAFLASGVVQAAASWGSVRGERPAWSRWRPSARWVLARCWPLGLAAVLGAVYYRLDALLVLHLAGPAAAGFYTAAYRILDILQLAPVALAAVLVPLLARSWSVGDRAGAVRVLQLAITVCAAVALPVAAGAAVAGDRIAQVLFGDDFRPAGELVAVLPLAFFSIASGYVYAGMVVALGRVRVLAAVAAVAACGTILADLLVIPAWGAGGAAWVTVAGEYAVSSTLAVWMRRRIGPYFPWRRLSAAAGASLVLGLVAWTVRGASLPLLVVLPLAAYAAAAWRLGAVTKEDLRSLAHPTRALGSLHAGGP